MDEAEIGRAMTNQRMGNTVKRALSYLPYFELTASVQPITRTIIRLSLRIRAAFTWSDKQHGVSEPMWVWVEDSDGQRIVHSEHYLFQKKMMEEEQTLIFTIPVSDHTSSQYYVQFISDRWLGCDYTTSFALSESILPGEEAPHTDLLPLRPLPVEAVGREEYEQLLRRKFTHFNPVQTQAFHTLYRTDHNVLLGAPTGSGKTVAAELSMFRVFSVRPDTKVVYIAPLKALVRERVEDWGKKLAPALGKKLVQLTGDFTPDIRALNAADIIIATPEKWDGISRSWRQRSYVRKVSLIILDEIHLLGADRGPILEVLVSRMRFIAANSGYPIRFVGLSTALANAHDIADWLGVTESGLFNFRPSVRPVPIEVHIQGFPGKHYCPRMASMNKPAYASIVTHSPSKPVLVFVSSRRQTRLTAMDLMQLCEQDGAGSRFLRMSSEELAPLLDSVRDTSLQHTLAYGIGLHHAGLIDSDKELVERLFVEGKIQILVSTSTLAWGVNFPAHLVVVKGTEYYDGKTKRYVDYPITDVLQMMGRAGRPQFDNLGKAVILVQDAKKSFYRKFLYEPFPVESSLMHCLHDHINAEIATGSIKKKRDALDYITWTYFFRRLLKNPAYYNLDEASDASVLAYLTDLVDDTLSELEEAGCILVDDDEEKVGGDGREMDGREVEVQATPLGRIASFYYLQYKTVGVFHEELKKATTFEDLLAVLAEAAEFDELPVRHNEDKLNATLASTCRYSVDANSFDSPHVKANLLLQAHLSRLDLPVADYVTDTKSVLDQTVRVVQAMIDICADKGKHYLATLAILLQQCIAQRRWHDDDTLMMIPSIGEEGAKKLRQAGIVGVGHFLALPDSERAEVARRAGVKVAEKEVQRYPLAMLRASVKGVTITANRNGEVSVKAGEEIQIHIGIERRGPGAKAPARHLSSVPAFTPGLAKSKDEGWYVLAADEKEGEVKALKRLTAGTEAKTGLSFLAPTSPCRQHITILLMSDCYVGLDQQLSLRIHVQP
uniref:RNA helicase n=1 Tax=Palpitomonas bilix TaxID=652834 RepID=A0A7S3G5F7_9EUKA